MHKLSSHFWGCYKRVFSAENNIEQLNIKLCKHVLSAQPKIEDEYHFLAVWPIYMDEKNRLKLAFNIKVDKSNQGNHNFFSCVFNYTSLYFCKTNFLIYHCMHEKRTNLIELAEYTIIPVWLLL